MKNEELLNASCMFQMIWIDWIASLPNFASKPVKENRKRECANKQQYNKHKENP